MSPQHDTATATATFCATLVDEWLRCGIRTACVAPGSRSTPLALALAARPEIRVEIFHDERSAAFAALGAAMATGVPALVVCTSGTAAAHFHAAVVEAHLSDVPMIVCTADRPPELRDVGAPQTIDQTKLYGDAVRWFHDPGVPSFDAASTWRGLAARVVATATGQRPGPVHLNLPFREPLVGTPDDLPAPRSAPQSAGSDSAWMTSTVARHVADHELADLAARLSGRRGIIVAGRGATGEVLELARALGWPVLADPLSGLRECDPNVVVAFDCIVRAQSASMLVPDVVVRVGAPPASKVLAQWIARHQPTVIQLSATEAVIDPDHSVAHRIVGEIGQMCRSLTRSVEVAGGSPTEQTPIEQTPIEKTPIEQAWNSLWVKAETAAQTALSRWVENNWSEIAVARTVTDSVPAGGRLVVSSSMPIRDVEWFGAVTPGVGVHANRGANGIDGVVSTAVGVAVASGDPTTLLIGDVALLHDSNGLLGLAQRDVSVTIVVTNNDGGSIFSFLPQADVVSHQTFELLYGTPHGVKFEHLAAAHGLSYRQVASVTDLREAVVAGGTQLVEVVCDRAVNVSLHQQCQATIADAVDAALNSAL